MSIQELFGPIAANDTEANCEHCGTSFTPRHGRRFCTDECQRSDYNAKRRGDKVARLANAPEHVCEHCGVTFRRRKGKNSAARFCSRECGFAAKSNLRAEHRIAPGLREAASVFAVSYSVARCVCGQCGVRFIGSSLADRYCSSECRDARRKQAHWESRGVDTSPRLCPHCCEPFAITYGRAHAVYCTDECAKAAARKSPAARAAKARRKAMARGCGDNDNIDPLEVFARDGWRCQLCGVKTPKRLRGSCEPNAPGLDHIMPIAMGGAHTYANTQCACRRCNGAKGAQFIGQLRLFG